MDGTNTCHYSCPLECNAVTFLGGLDIELDTQKTKIQQRALLVMSLVALLLLPKLHLHHVLQSGQINRISLWKKLGTRFKVIMKIGDHTLLFAPLPKVPCSDGIWGAGEITLSPS